MRLGLTLIAALILSLLPGGLAAPALAVGTASISGTVSVPAGVEVTKINVTASGPIYATAYANANGTFTIPGLEAGTYTVAFNHYGQDASPVVEATYSGGAVTVAAEAVTGINQTLKPAAIVSGTISVPAGAEQYSGYVEVRGGPTFESYGGSAYIDPFSNGAFAVGGLAPGTYKVFYSPTGNDAWASMWRGGVPRASDSTAITLTEGQRLTGINDQAVAAATISGSITGGDSHHFIQAVAADGTIVKNAGSNAPGTSSYSMKNLFPGTYTIQFNRASGLATTSEAQYYNNLPEGSGTGATPVTANAGQTKAEVNAVMKTGATLTGKIVGSAGQALENVPVRVYTKDGSLVTRGTNTGADGTFRATGLTTGSYVVAANMIATRASGALGKIFSGNVRDESSASPVTTTVGQNTDIGTLSFATAGGTGVPVFTDVPTGSQFAGEISWLAEKAISTGWTEGDGSKTYRPLQPVNRDAMAAFMYRLAGKPAFTPPAVSPFNDVPVGAQFYKEITWLAGQGISTGWTEGDGSKTYRPLQPVNRDAMAAFMYRLAGKPAFTAPTASPFTDVPAGAQFYKEITWLASQNISTGWTEGDGSKTYRPLQPVNRDAMAAFMFRYNSKFGSI